MMVVDGIQQTYENPKGSPVIGKSLTQREGRKRQREKIGMAPGPPLCPCLCVG